MRIASPASGAFYTTLRLALIAGFVLASAGAASATTDKKAIEVCKTEMTEEHAALNLRDFRVRRHEDLPFVYGTADFEDIKGIHFRCKVSHDKVRKVRYLVKDPEFVDGRAWAKKRPRGKIHEGLELDDAAKAPPPLDHPSPHFVRVPKKP